MHALLALGLALAAAGGPAPAKHRAPKCMVLPIPRDPAFSETETHAINDFLAGAFRDQGLTVITPEAIAAALGIEKSKALLGCSETSCLAEIGGAMGVDYIARGTVAALDKDTAITLILTDASGITVSESRKLVRARSSSALIQSIEQQVPQLMTPVRARLGDTAPVASVEQGPDAAGPSRVPAYVGFGVAAVLGGAAGVLAIANAGKYSDLKKSYTSSAASSLRTTDAVADGLTAGALVAAGVGAYLYLSASPAGPGAGGEVGLRGSF